MKEFYLRPDRSSEFYLTPVEHDFYLKQQAMLSKWYNSTRNTSRCSSYSVLDAEPDYYSSSIPNHDRTMYSITDPPGKCQVMNKKYGFAIKSNHIYQIDIINLPTDGNIIDPSIDMTFPGENLDTIIGVTEKYVYVTEYFGGITYIACLDAETLLFIGRIQISGTGLYFIQSTFSSDGDMISFLYRKYVTDHYEIFLKILSYDLQTVILDSDPELIDILSDENSIYTRKKYSISGLTLWYNLKMDSDPVHVENYRNQYQNYDSYIETGDPEWPIDHCVTTYYDTDFDSNGAYLINDTAPDVNNFGDAPRYTNVQAITSYGSYAANGEKVIIGYEPYGTILKCFNKSDGSLLWTYNSPRTISEYIANNHVYMGRVVYRKTGTSTYWMYLRQTKSYNYISKISFIRVLAISATYVMCEEIEFDSDLIQLDKQYLGGYTMGTPENEYPPYNANQMMQYHSFQMKKDQRTKLVFLDINTGVEMFSIDFPRDDYKSTTRRFYTALESVESTEKYELMMSRDAATKSDFAISDEHACIFRLIADNGTLVPFVVGYTNVGNYIPLVSMTVLSTHNYSNTYPQYVFTYSMSIQAESFSMSLGDSYVSLMLINNTVYIKRWSTTSYVSKYNATTGSHIENDLFLDRKERSCVSMNMWGKTLSSDIWHQENS